MREPHPLITLAVLLLGGWLSLPDHKRRQLLMRTAQALMTTTQRLARATGRYGMSLETQGDPHAAHAAYTAGYDLMTGPYARLAAWYDTLREH